MELSVRLGRCLFVPVALLCTQCGAPANDEGRAPDDESFGTQQEAIKNGYVLSSETYSGIVALQTWYAPASSYLTICTGTLMTNNKLITAQHCSQAYPGTLYAKMGTQFIQVIDRAPHPSYDFAVFKLGGNMTMPNWHFGRFLTSPVQYNTTDYGRSIYPGTNASLNGMSLMCFGYGGASKTGPYQPPLTYGVFTGKYPSGFTGWGGIQLLGITASNPSSAYIEDGDSGGGCLDNLSTYASQIASVHSSYNLDVAAGDFRNWAAYVIAYW